MKTDASLSMESELTRWLPYIEARLGRQPRGLRAIAAYNTAGKPAVIRVASVVERKPFPTLFWLIDPVLNLSLDRLEAKGEIARLQEQVEGSLEMQEAMSH